MRQILAVTACCLVFCWPCLAQTNRAPDGADAPEVVLALPKASVESGTFSVFSPATLASKQISPSARQVALKEGEWLAFTQSNSQPRNADWLLALGDVASRLWTVVFTKLTDEEAAHVEKLVELRGWFKSFKEG